MPFKSIGRSGKLGQRGADASGNFEQSFVFGTFRGKKRIAFGGEQLLENHEIFIVLHAVAEHLQTDAADGIVRDEILLAAVCGGFGGINEAAVAVAERTVVRGNPRHRIQVWILEGVRIDGGACPVVARPDEDALHVVVPCLP